jgi:hypothetical protein
MRIKMHRPLSGLGAGAVYERKNQVGEKINFSGGPTAAGLFWWYIATPVSSGRCRRLRD